MRLFALSAGMLVVFSVAPACAQSLQGRAAYEELLTKAAPGDVVTVGGERLLIVPKTAGGLPGGYNGFFDTRSVTLSDGTKVMVIDPSRPITITKPAAAAAQLPERARRIMAAMQKDGLAPRITAVPEGIAGHRIDATLGAIELGGKFTQIFVHIGDPAKLAKFQSIVVANNGPGAAFSPAAGWVGSSTGTLHEKGLAGDLWGYTRAVPGSDGHVSYMAGFGFATAIDAKSDATVTVQIERYGNENLRNYMDRMSDQFRGRSDEIVKATAALDAKLEAGLQTEARNWLTLLAAAVDRADGASTRTAGEPPPPPKVEAPSARPEPKPRPEVKPVPEGKPVAEAPPETRPGLLESVTNYWNRAPQRERPKPPDEDQQRPTAKDDARSMVSGGVKLSVGGVALGLGLGAISAPLWPGYVMVGVGAGLVVKGYLMLHGQKPADLAIDVGKATPIVGDVIRDAERAVRTARDGVKKAQEMHWQQLSDPELAEMVRLDDLSRMTKEQRARVYEEAGAPLQNRIEALVDLKKHQQWLDGRDK